MALWGSTIEFLLESAAGTVAEVSTYVHTLGAGRGLGGRSIDVRALGASREAAYKSYRAKVHDGEPPPFVVSPIVQKCRFFTRNTRVLAESSRPMRNCVGLSQIRTCESMHPASIASLVYAACSGYCLGILRAVLCEPRHCASYAGLSPVSRLRCQAHNTGRRSVHTRRLPAL